MTLHWCLAVVAALSVALLTPTLAAADPIPVELRQTETGWQLLRGGEPYFIKGAGGDGPLDQLAAAGANSVRTWGADDLDARLDEAHALGLTVAVGIWLGHERHGFDYGDPAQVAAQLDKVRAAVTRYRAHPAVLLWGIGNEMEGYESGDDPRIWAAVEQAAALAKELDPNHPTMSVTADIGGGRVPSVSERCPSVDIHGINSYGGALSLPERYRAAGGTKPYVLTEFGPAGVWEIPTNEWGAPAEQTSTEKASSYAKAHELGVAAAPGLALGAYAFTWGFKMEATATWYGMFLPDGSRLGAIDAMTRIWSGAQPPNRSPVVEPLVVEGSPQLDPGAVLRVQASVADSDGDPIRVRWVLRPESGDYHTGGDYRPMLPDIDGAVTDGSTAGATVTLPNAPGPYRLFLYAYDGQGNAATANVPLLVRGEVRTPLPLAVYEDGAPGSPWVASGWMGRIDALGLDEQHTERCHDGPACIRLSYAAIGEWAGIAWQNPPNNWGDQPGGVDLTGATQLEFWARGEQGRERIDVSVGLIGDDKPYPDSAVAKLGGVGLKRRWKRYRIDLTGHDLSSIKTAFVLTVAGRGAPTVVYLDRIRFVGPPPTAPD